LSLLASKDPIIIIGSGLAGYNVAREFRKLNSDTALVIIADDAADFYSKPMLSNALAKSKTAQDLPIADVKKMADDLNAKILNHTRVEKIEPENHVIYTNKNESLKYSQLVLALGAAATILSVAGNASDKIYSVNDLKSYAAFRDAIRDKKKIAIIGAGLIGCEFANDLILSDYEVSVIGSAHQPLNRLLPEQAANYLKEALANTGINWHLGDKPKQVNFNNSVFNINLESGTCLEVDVVLSAIGLRPNIKIAQEAGIEVNKAIVVNQSLQTNCKDIFALGDCAEVAGLFLPFVMPLMNAARALAKSLDGELTEVTYPAMPVLVKTPSCSVVAVVPATKVKGEWQVKQDEDGIDARFVDQDNRLQGFALVGKAVEAKAALMQELPVVLA